MDAANSRADTCERFLAPMRRRSRDVEHASPALRRHHRRERSASVKPSRRSNFRDAIEALAEFLPSDGEGQMPIREVVVRLLLIGIRRECCAREHAP
jgi:hypothetical protein